MTISRNVDLGHWFSRYREAAGSAAAMFTDDLMDVLVDKIQDAGLPSTYAKAPMDDMIEEVTAAVFRYVVEADPASEVVSNEGDGNE